MQPPRVWIERRTLTKGKSYRVRWRDAAGDKHTVGSTADHKTAQAMLQRKRDELRGLITGERVPVTVAEFTETLKLLMKGKAVRTIEKTIKTVNQFAAHAGVQHIGDIDESLVLRWRGELVGGGHYVIPTVNRMLRELRSALSYAAQDKIIGRNPILGLRGLSLKEAERTVRVVEAAEYAALIKSCKFWSFGALLITAYRQGLRRTELANLRWIGPRGEAVVDLERRVLHVINRPEDDELTKSRKNRAMPLHAEAHKTLTGLWGKTRKIIRDGKAMPRSEYVFCHAGGARYLPDWIDREFARTRARAGVNDCTIHDLRRSFSTLAQRAGVDPHVVQELGGWSTVGVVKKHYTGDVSEGHRLAMDKIEGADNATAAG